MSRLQNFVEDKISKMEVEQTELKNRLLNIEKQKIIERSPSLVSRYTKGSFDNRTNDDSHSYFNHQKSDHNYSGFQSRYRSEKRTPTDAVTPSDNKYIDEDYLKSLRKNYSNKLASDGFAHY